MSKRCVLTILTCLLVLSAAAALPVHLGEVEIGLESFDGYQEGMARLTTDEKGGELEILIAYKGFGLDTVTWTFPAGELPTVRDSVAQAAWWRSRLLEMDVDQTVLKDLADIAPMLTYAYRESTYPFDSSDSVLRFVRQGRDYALLLAEKAPGAETRRSGRKALPVFTMHFPGKWLPALRDMLSESEMERVLAEYADQKAAIEGILSSGPEAAAASAE